VKHIKRKRGASNSIYIKQTKGKGGNKKKWEKGCDVNGR
jgi:hypothetical protein